MKSLLTFIVMLTVTSLLGCTAGDLRLLNDTLSSANGNTPYYYDQKYSDFVGDVEVVYGVRNEQGFVQVINHGSNYCKVKVTYEDESSRIYDLRPRRSTSTMYMDLYNQPDEIRSLCGASDNAFEAPFSVQQ